MKHQSNTQAQIEAAVFRKLVEHLQQCPDVQNIDLMNLAGFCRNCLSKWYVTASIEAGVSVDYEQARDLVYGMKYSEWKQKFQTEASAASLEKIQSREASK